MTWRTGMTEQANDLVQPACPNTSDGQHCYDILPAAVPSMDPPEGGWPILQECRHCRLRRQRQVTVTYRYLT